MTSRGQKFVFRLLAAAVPAAVVIAGPGMPGPTRTSPQPPYRWLVGAAAAAELHGRKLATAYCAGCHGPDGNSADAQYPKLAGQKASYLLSEMRAFRSGARKSDLMSGPASAITDSQMVELADFYSRQTVKPDAVKDAGLASRGSRIFLTATRGAPSCAACHSQGGSGGMGGMMDGRRGMMGGMGMMGSAANAPALNGQHAVYTAKALDAFASGARRATVMGPIAAALSEGDRRAVAEYLSGLR